MMQFFISLKKQNNPKNHQSVLLGGMFVLRTKIACMELLLKIHHIFA